MNAEMNSHQRTRRDPDYEARLERIGDILARGVARLLAKEREAKKRQEASAASEPGITVAEVSKFTNREADLLALLQQFRRLRPCEIRERLECSRATVGRMTGALQKQGFIQCNGLTSSTTYALTRQGEVAVRGILGSR